MLATGVILSWQCRVSRHVITNEDLWFENCQCRPFRSRASKVWTCTRLSLKSVEYPPLYFPILVRFPQALLLLWHIQLWVSFLSNNKNQWVFSAKLWAETYFRNYCPKIHYLVSPNTGWVWYPNSPSNTVHLHNKTTGSCSESRNRIGTLRPSDTRWANITWR